MVHELKTWPEYFVSVMDGTKPFEVRKNDRDYRIGDQLLLKEYIPAKDFFTGRILNREITYILKGGSFGVHDGYVVLGLK